MSFFGELKRRKVFRVGAAYAIVGWLLIQVAIATFPQLQLPAWAPTLVTVLVLLGFPVALILAWAFELTPGGIKASRAAPEPAGAAVNSDALDYVLIAGLVLVAAATVWAGLRPAPEANRAAASAATSMPSIAVLPFADMSPAGDQAYFGDGMAEELLNELTRLEGLRVAGRTSSFLFKSSDQDLREIGAALGVASILEGSVRKDGNRIRITAQLISADGYHLWSETYDRELNDIFEIQEEIATTVAGELGVRLGVGRVNTFLGAGTRNIEAYEAYLQGIAYAADGDRAAALRLLDRAIELDPDYAAAWARRGLTTASTVWEQSPEDAPAIVERAYTYVKRAVELDPNSAEAQTYLGSVTYAGYDWIGGHEAHLRAIALRRDRETLGQHGHLLMRTGRLEAARAQYAAAEAAEPLGGRPIDLKIDVALGQSEFQEAHQIAAWRLFPAERAHAELDIALNEHDPESVKSALAALTQFPTAAVAAATLFAPVLDVFDSPESVLAVLRAARADTTARWPEKLHDIAMLAAYFGAPELALDAIAEEGRAIPARLGTLWYPIMAEVRHSPGFKQFVTEIHVVDYWRMYGWADACRPVGEDDFTCG